MNSPLDKHDNHGVVNSKNHFKDEESAESRYLLFALLQTVMTYIKIYVDFKIQCVGWLESETA